MRGSRGAVAIGLALAVSACGSLAGQGGWGPLAVVEATGDAALTEGTLRITDTCVFLDERGEVGLLVWPADQTRWNALDRSIEFETTSGQSVTLVSGQRVSLGGGGSSVAEDGPAWIESIEWVNPPNPACLTDGAWFVTSVE